MNHPSPALVALVCLSAAAGFGLYRGLQWVNARPVAADQWAPPVIDAATAAVAAAASGANQPDGAGTEPEADTEAGQAHSVASIPEEVPDLTMPDLQGQRHALRSYRGRPVIYNFWASWCVPCRREVPLLNRIQQQAGEKSLTVVGIAADLQANVVEFTKTTKMNYTLLVGEQEGAEAAQRFGVPLVLPFSVFTASDGRVVALKLGELHRDEATAMLASIRRLDQGKLTLAQARKQIADRLRELAAERATQGASAS